MDTVYIFWLCVWGAMYTGMYNVQSFLSDDYDGASLFQAARAFLPLLVLCICFMQLLSRGRTSIPHVKSPLDALFYYWCCGMLASFFSPVPGTALYWAGNYAAGILLVWTVMRKKDPGSVLRGLIYLNYAVFILFVAGILPEALRIGWGKDAFTQVYVLPFGLGEIKSNGVGRYATVLSILAGVRMLHGQRRNRIFWLGLLFVGLFLLIQTRSRTALLGFAVAGMIIMVIRGFRWLAVPFGLLSLFVAWVASFQWRAEGDIEQLVFLSGRESTWQKGFELFLQSPLIGWGFHADRLMLDFEHMHHTYLHALVQSGVVGTLFLVLAMAGIWRLLFRIRRYQRNQQVSPADRVLFLESWAIIGFLTARSFFESTAAFYGIDLLLLLPIMGYLQVEENRWRTASL